MDSVRYGLARRGGASHADSPPPHDRRRGGRHESAIDSALARPLRRPGSVAFQAAMTPFVGAFSFPSLQPIDRSEEHTSELQSLRHLVCRLLLEKKKQTQQQAI